MNLGKDHDNIMLHFNPRFDFEGDVSTIVCNSKQGGIWGEEERDTYFPFQQGEKFQVTGLGRQSTKPSFIMQGNSAATVGSSLFRIHFGMEKSGLMMVSASCLLPMES